jgi:hypothetical protein
LPETTTHAGCLASPSTTTPVSSAGGLSSTGAAPGWSTPLEFIRDLEGHCVFVESSSEKDNCARAPLKVGLQKAGKAFLACAVHAGACVCARACVCCGAQVTLASSEDNWPRQMEMRLDERRGEPSFAAAPFALDSSSVTREPPNSKISAMRCNRWCESSRHDSVKKSGELAVLSRRPLEP